MTEKVALIGAGAMGGAIGTRLAETGNDLTVFDLDKEKVQALVDKGAKAADSAAEAAAASDTGRAHGAAQGVGADLGGGHHLRCELATAARGAGSDAVRMGLESRVRLGDGRQCGRRWLSLGTADQEQRRGSQERRHDRRNRAITRPSSAFFCHRRPAVHLRLSLPSPDRGAERDGHPIVRSPVVPGELRTGRRPGVLIGRVARAR